MSSTLIAIIISIVVALLMLISFFVGRKRGVKRTLLEGGLTFIMLILAFFLTPPITTALMGIQTTINDEPATLGTAITKMLIKEKDIGPFVENSNSVQSFLNGIIPAVASVIIFIVICFIFKLIAFIVYKIIEKFSFKTRKEEEELGKYRNKLGGGVLSAIKTLVFIVIIFLPFTSLSGFVEKNFFSNYTEKPVEASSITDTLDKLPSTSEISNQIPSDAKKAIAGFNNSIVGLTGGVFGFDDICFDYLSNIDVRGNNVSIRQTAEDLLEFYDYSLDLYEDYKKEPKDFFKQLDYDKLDNYKKELLESGMFKGFILNVVYDYSQNYDKLLDKEMAEDYESILKDVKKLLSSSEKPTEVLLSDIYKVFDVVKVAGQTGLLDDINAMGENASAEDILLLIVDDYSDTAVTASVNAVFNINMVRASFKSIISEVQSKLGDGDLENALKEASGKISNWDLFIYDMNDILTDVGDLYDKMKDAGVVIPDFIDDPYLILKANPAKVEPIVNSVGIILDKVDNLELLKDKNKEKILNSILDAIGCGDLLKGIVVEGQTINYSYVFNKLGKSASYLLEFDLYKEIKDSNYNEAIAKIADAMYADSLKGKTEGELTKKAKVEEIFKTVYSLPRIKELTIDEFTDDLSSFVDIKVLDDALVRDKELSFMTDIMIELSKNKIEVNGEEQTFLRYILTEGNKFEGLVGSIKEENVEALLTPILKSAMTEKICSEIFDTISSTLTDAVGSEVKVEYNATSLRNDSEQIQETCDVFEKFIAVYNTGDISNIEDIEYTTLGKMLDVMKINAYRQELNHKTTKGIFREAFDALISKAEEEYAVDFKKTLSKSNIYEVEFENLFSLVEMIEEEKTGFGSALKVLLKEDATTTNIEALFNSINGENEDEVIEILTKAKEIGATVEASEVKITISSGEKVVEEAIDLYEFDNTITKLEEIKGLLKDLIV